VATTPVTGRDVSEFLDWNNSCGEDCRDASSGRADGPDAPTKGFRVTDAHDQAAALDATSQALVTLVIRGMVRGTPDHAVTELVDRGLAMSKGPITMPTPNGTRAAGELLRIEPRSEHEQAINTLFDAFLPINRRLRDVCSAWQTRPDGTPNGHDDLSYDDSVRERLDEVHSAIGPVLRRLGALDPSLATYRPRLQEALDKFDGGESPWLASPLMDSYHTVWMHLHQHLILMLGLTRAEDEAREESLVSGRAG